MADKKISEFPIFDGVQDAQTYYILASGEAGDPDADNYKMPFTHLAQDITANISLYSGLSGVFDHLTSGASGIFTELLSGKTGAFTEELLLAGKPIVSENADGGVDLGSTEPPPAGTDAPPVNLLHGGEQKISMDDDIIVIGGVNNDPTDRVEIINPTTIKETLTVADGKDTTLGGNTTIKETLTVADGKDTTLGGNTTIKETLTVADGKDTTLGGNTTIKETLTVADGKDTTLGGNTTIKETLTVADGKDTTLGGNTTIKETLTVADGKDTTLGGNTTIKETLTVADGKDTTLGGNTTIKETLTVADGKDTTLGGNTTIKGTTNLNSSLTVADGQDTTLGGATTIKGATTFNSTANFTDSTKITFGSSTPAQTLQDIIDAGGKWSDGTSAGKIHYSGGNVGIGVENPDARLEVDYVAATQIGLTLHGSNTALNNAIKLTDASNNEILLSIDAGKFGINGGNVGIGVTDPSAKTVIKSGVNSLPDSDISADTGTALRILGADAAAIDLGLTGRVNNGGVGQWIQARHSEVDSTYYDLLLNPIGGNVGIGTVDPDVSLHVGNGNGSKAIKITSGGGSSGDLIFDSASNEGMVRYEHTTDSMRLHTNGSEAMRIDSAGNVGIGVTDPGAKLEIKTETIWGTYTNEALTISNIGSSGNVNQQHGLGRIKWETNNTIGASIDAIRNTPDDGNNVDLVFSTNPGGSNTALTERMRINHEGAIIIQNTTAPTVTTNKLHANAGKLYWNGSELASGSSSNFAAVNHNHAISDITGLQTALNGKASSSHTHTIANITGLQTALDGKASSSHTHTIANITGLQAALNAAGSSNVSAINDLSDVNITSLSDNDILYYDSSSSKWVNDAPTEPAFISDKKYKTEIFPISDALLKVNSIKGANFTWSDDAPSDLSGKKDVGVIAQDIQKILPEAVEEKENGDLTVKYHRIIPLLIESIKQLSAQNNALKSRLDKIEGIL